MDEKGMLWVLSKLKFSLARPICDDNSGVTVYTWCAKPTKFFSNRMFELYDDNDNLLCSAYSSWLVIDRNSRKIVITFAEDACGFHGATSVEIVYHKEIVGGDILLYVKQEADVYYVVGEVDGTMCFTVKLA